MQTDAMAPLLVEAQRQAEICNACRYCEGYCAVFPALHSQRSFAAGDLTQLANLCHNCRGCYYACQYTAPHEFDLNLPAALADLRQAGWEGYAWPGGLARLFMTSGAALGLSIALGFALIFAAMRALGPTGGAGFYAFLSHSAMVAIFLPAFLLPLVALAVGLRRYWRDVGGGPLHRSDVVRALSDAARLRNLSGGHGDGCNFEEEDRFSPARRRAHHAVMYGFLLCFLSTSSATLMHYGADMPAPYPLLSLPKLFGLPGGLLMVAGGIWLMALKLRSARHLGAAGAWGGEMGFILLLVLVAASGLALYAAGAVTQLAATLPALLALHLGAVLSLFLLTPYTKMAHGAFRLAALIREAQRLRIAKQQRIAEQHRIAEQRRRAEQHRRAQPG
ncbi:MAG: tricarballylate utilization 4Fe-4S protein TcuB [Pseudomonadota bacterium]